MGGQEGEGLYISKRMGIASQWAGALCLSCGDGMGGRCGLARDTDMQTIHHPRFSQEQINRRRSSAVRKGTFSS